MAWCALQRINDNIRVIVNSKGVSVGERVVIFFSYIVLCTVMGPFVQSIPLKWNGDVVLFHVYSITFRSMQIAWSTILAILDLSSPYSTEIYLSQISFWHFCAFSWTEMFYLSKGLCFCWGHFINVCRYWGLAKWFLNAQVVRILFALHLQA